MATGIITTALDQFPGMEKDYRELCHYWSPAEPSDEAFFADVVGPYLIKISKEGSEDQVAAFFEFVDSIRERDDLKQCLQVGVIDVIEDVPEVKRVSSDYLVSV